MGDALSLPCETTLNLDQRSGQHKTSNTYKRYVLPTFLQPGYPYLDYPPNLLTNKESLLYVLKYAFLLGDVPLHLREIDPIEKMFQSLEATHWDAETWVRYARECMENAGFFCETNGLVDSMA